MPENTPNHHMLRQIRRVFLRLGALFILVLGVFFFTGIIDRNPAIIAGALNLLIGVGYYAYIGRRRSKWTVAGLEPSDPPRIKTEDAEVRAARQLIGALAQPALILRDNQIEACNAIAGRLFGLPQDPLGLSAASLRDPLLLAAIDRVGRSEGGKMTCEIEPVRRPGEAWLAGLATLTEGAGHDGVLIVLTDQGPVRRAKSARADFLANASHELRTPLTSIAGFIETMKGPARDDMQAWPRFIDIMDEQTAHMRHLIADLLSLSRIELTEHLLPDTSIDLADTTEQAVEALRHLAAARGLTLNVHAAAGGFPVVGDEGEMKQVIANLVGNAMKYAPDDGEIVIELGRAGSLSAAQNEAARSWAGAGRATLLEPEPSGQDAVWLRVRDSGPGIAMSYLPRLGERFYRVDGSRGGPIEGTGLGLAIVKHIMSRHRGGLAVESIPDEGAAFSVWLSCTNAAQDRAKV